MRGVPDPCVGSTEGELQTVLVDLVQVKMVNVPMFRIFQNMRVSAFHARGDSGSTPIPHQFDLTYLDGTQFRGRHSARVGGRGGMLSQPVFSAFEKTTTFFLTSCRTATYMQRSICGGTGRCHQ